MRTHRSLINGAERIVAVIDCFSGKILRVFNRRYELGEIVRTVGIQNRNRTGADTEKQFWVVTGHSSWQAAKAMARKCGPIAAASKLQSGVWHEVISE